MVRTNQLLLDIDDDIAAKQMARGTGLKTHETDTSDKDISELTEPSSYTGLYGFHKYWGKKPAEPLRFLVKELTEAGDLVVDPFVGSGAIGKETVQAGRRFIGGDLNPIGVHLTKFFLSPCTPSELSSALHELERDVRPLIEETYQTEDKTITSHILWNEKEISSVWQRNGSRKRLEREPTQSDITLADKWDSYRPRFLRPLRFFDNSRINARIDLDWNSIFTGRALRNIELLLEHVRGAPSEVRHALELVLTSSIGQMSKMVFAITSRGKMTGKTSNRTEVGSWVIGYWRPRTYFEVNVWNCFESKGNKLLRGLQDIEPSNTEVSSIKKVLSSCKKVAVERQDAIQLLRRLPDNSISLLLTDPPHGDRIPYLELSEMWNAVLGETSSYEEEMVVSNGRQRNKTLGPYLATLNEFFALAFDKLKLGGVLALMFNSRRLDEWAGIRKLVDSGALTFVGRFPLTYSATSVVQDNREGSMKTDYVLLFSKGAAGRRLPTKTMKKIPGWSDECPEI